MDFSPMVSIVIPVYNGASYMREAIDSALAQTYPNTEVIVVNDGSRDGGATERIALEYGDRIRYIPKENGGVSTALNTGIRAMRGQYVSWLSHDDVFVPNKLELQIDRLRGIADKNVVLYGDYDYIDSSGRFLSTFRIDPPAPESMRHWLILSAPINGCTALIPKLCFDETGLFDETLRTTQDYDLWFKMAEKYSFIHMPEVLLKSRFHAEQGSWTISGHDRECNAMYIQFLNEIALDAVSVKAWGGASRYLIEAAIYLRKRGLYPAAGHALSMCKAHMAEAGFDAGLQARIWFYWICDIKARLFRIKLRLKFMLSKKS